MFTSLSRQAAFTALAALASSVRGIDFQEVPSPNLDLSQLGRVALAGDFDAISIYRYKSQNEDAFTTNGSQAILTQLPNGLFDTLETSDGFIFGACPFVRRDGDAQGVVVGGNFTSLGSTQIQGIALWKPEDNEVVPLSGLTGSVRTVFCDKDMDTVFVGGTFKGGNSTNAMAWIGRGEWNNLPFQGFNGPVNAITKLPNSQSVIFAGQFSTVGNTSLAGTPENQQIVNIGTSAGDVSASASSSQNGLGDPTNILCKTGAQDGPGNTWLLADGQPGVWKVLSNYKYEPTKIRIYNTKYQGRGTKSFAIRAFPQNGQMNLTYTDPVTKQNASCIQDCPLAQDLEYQDFTFVNVIAMGGFQIEVNAWYGAGGGLDGVQLIQDANYVYAVSDFNEPSCSNSSMPSNSTATGPWKVTPSGQNNANYLTADLQGPGVNSNSASVIFYPDIKQAGTYMVNVFTPGCQIEGTCQQRGIANVTAQYAANQPVQQVNIPQNNNFEKYDQIYSDHVDLPSGSFRPYIKIQPLDNQNDPISLVALRVKFTLMQANGSASDGTVATVSSSSVVNGLFEYDPNNATVDPNFSSSPLNVAGANLSHNALITSMAAVKDNLYIAGNFSTNEFSNVFAFGNGQSIPLAQGGLDNHVASMIAWGNLLFMGGNFTNTKTAATGLAKGVVAYDTAANSWLPLGGGVNGAVSALVPLQLNITKGQTQSCITVNGQFTQVLPGPTTKGFNASDGFAVWVPAYNDWLQNLNLAQPAISGQLTFAVNYTDGQSLLAGTISSQGMAIQDAVALSTEDGNATISSLGLQEPSIASLGQNKAEVAARLQPNVSGAVTGLFIHDGPYNLSVVAGNFETTATNGSTVNNLVFINTADNGTNTITGIADGLNANSTFLSLARKDGSDTLYAGGTVGGQVNGNAVNGLVLWDLKSSSYATGQPPSLNANGNNVSVNSISIRPTSEDVYVGGSFASAGLLPCPALCIWSNGQWNRPGSEFDGVVSTQMWQGNTKLLVGGNFTSGPNNTYLATYDSAAAAQEQAWSTPGNVSAVPGPVTVLTPANSDNSQYWLAGKATNGSAYMMKYDGSNYRTVVPQFGAQTTIRGLSVLSLQSDHTHTNTDLLDGNFVILVTGSLNIPNYGNASAALFNGTDLTPFILSNSGNGPGSISQLVVEHPQSFKTGKAPLALGFVVLIALAIALGLIFILVLIGMALERWRRRREGYRPAPQNYVEKTANMGRIPPDQLFGNLSRGTEGPRI